ncbi:MAG TPA: hypothetical protein VJW73_18020 [Gemmatimonadaceae bacterium]|nr:hypothetical protein [Gemmatimonadaceae bacterium]
MRSLCTGLLALLAWLPVGHAQSRVLRGNPHEPALAVTSALDLAADSPSRVGSAGSFSERTLPPRRPPRLPAGDGASFAEVAWRPVFVASRGIADEAQDRRGPRIRAKRLTIPYDATAPPRQS